MLATEEKPQALEYWPLSQLKPNPLNPRGPVDPSSVEDLAASIRSKGILEPLIVTPDGWIVAGHRRQAAAKLAGLTVAPIVIRELSKAEQLEIMLAENLQREDLSPVQEARAYQGLIDQGRTQADICRQVGISGPRVQNRLAILRLPATVQQLFDRGEIPLHAAGLLARVVDPHQQARFGQLIARRRLTVDKLKEIVNGEGIRVLPKGNPGPARAAAVPEEEDEEACDPSTQPGRTEAISTLEAHAKRALTFKDILDVFDPVCGLCGDCGMHSLEDICRECPLPRLVRRLAER